jgi:hypothetical protein
VPAGVEPPPYPTEFIVWTVSGGAESFVDVQNRRMSEDYERVSETGEAFMYEAMIRLIVRRSAHLGDYVDRF